MKNNVLKRFIIRIGSMLLCCLFAFAFVSCGGDTGDKNASEPAFYTVTFHYNLGFEEDSSEASVESGKTAADKVPNMIHSGYVFDGWCTDEELTQVFDIENTPVTSDITLYARWKKENDRAWFLSQLGEYAANATNDNIVRTKVSYKVRLNGAEAEAMEAEIVDGGITVGEYTVRLSITANWFEEEFLNGEGITVTSETYHERTGMDGISATVHYVNGANENRIYSVSIDKYGYVSGCSEKIDNGETKTPLYLLSSFQYE